MEKIWMIDGKYTPMYFSKFNMRFVLFEHWFWKNIIIIPFKKNQKSNSNILMNIFQNVCITFKDDEYEDKYFYKNINGNLYYKTEL
jgi:hypothetical protein